VDSRTGPDCFSRPHHLYAARPRGGFSSAATAPCLRAPPVTRARTASYASTSATAGRGYAADAGDAAGASVAAKKQGHDCVFDAGVLDRLGELNAKLRGAKVGAGRAKVRSRALLDLLDLARDNHQRFGPDSVKIAYSSLLFCSQMLTQHGAHPAFALLAEAAVRCAPLMDGSALSTTIVASGVMASRGMPVNVHEGQAMSAEVVRLVPEMSGYELMQTLGGWQGLAAVARHVIGCH